MLPQKVSAPMDSWQIPAMMRNRPRNPWTIAKDFWMLTMFCSIAMGAGNIFSWSGVNDRELTRRKCINAKVIHTSHVWSDLGRRPTVRMNSLEAQQECEDRYRSGSVIQEGADGRAEWRRVLGMVSVVLPRSPPIHERLTALTRCTKVARMPVKAATDNREE